MPQDSDAEGLIDKIKAVLGEARSILVFPETAEKYPGSARVECSEALTNKALTVFGEPKKGGGQKSPGVYSLKEGLIQFVKEQGLKNAAVMLSSDALYLPPPLVKALDIKNKNPSPDIDRSLRN